MDFLDHVSLYFLKKDAIINLIFTKEEVVKVGLSAAEMLERDKSLQRLKITKYNDKLGYVFVSYKSDDWKKVFEGKIFDLQRNGLRVYSDKNFDDSNHPWLEDMEKNVKHCSAFVMFISREYLLSYATLIELLTAINYNKQIVPIYLDNKYEMFEELKADVDLEDALVTMQPKESNRLQDLFENLENSLFDKALKPLKKSFMEKITTQKFAVMNIVESFEKLLNNGELNDNMFDKNLESLMRTISDAAKGNNNKKLVEVFGEKQVIEEVEAFPEKKESKRAEEQEMSMLSRQPEKRYTFDLTVDSPVNVKVYLNDPDNLIMQVDLYSGFSYKSAEVTTKEQFLLILKTKAVEHRVRLEAPETGRYRYDFASILTEDEIIESYDRVEAWSKWEREPNGYSMEQLGEVGEKEDVERLLAIIDDISNAYQKAECARAIGKLGQRYKINVSQKLAQVYDAYEAKSSYGYLFEKYCSTGTMATYGSVEKKESKASDSKTAVSQGISSKLNQILKVLDKLWALPRPIKDYSKAFSVAAKEVSEELGITKSAVIDKCQRQLGLSANEFRTLVVNYVEEGDAALCELLMKHANTEEEKAAVKQRF